MSDLGLLTPDILRQLYLEEGLTESEIATRYGLYQVKVNRMRKAAGIPTQVKSARLGLPAELPPRLHSILIGSMLGDGSLDRTGGATARYVEHHAAKQKAYLDWKVAEWGPFVSKVIPSNKGAHVGHRLITHGCTALHPYHELFYPANGDKTCARLDPAQVDALALAVWFMDDGSATESYIRFHVGPDRESQRVQLDVLRQFGLTGRLYAPEKDTSIHIEGRTQLTRFVDLVEAYIHPSLSYKLDLRPRQAGVAPRDLLTHETVRPLVERGLSLQDMAQILGVGRTTIGRALRQMGFPARPVGRHRREVQQEFTVEDATRLIQGLDPQAPEHLESVLRVLTRTPIPLPVQSKDAIQHDIALLRRAGTCRVGDSFEHISKAGVALCNECFPYRWDARYWDNASLRQAWYDERLVRAAVGFQLRVGDPVTPLRVLRALQVVVHAPTNFRPCLAKAVVETFCPAGGVVLDPCAGYGGRAAGSIAAGRAYVGVDPHPKAADAYAQLHALLGGSLTFHNEPFEDVSLGGLRADLVFTSPPYFCVERYSDDPTQSWVRYKTWTSWVAGFLRPFVEKSYTHLRDGGHFCVNTKNLRRGSAFYPLGDTLAALAVEAGFQREPVLQIPLGRVGKAARSEALYVFRKPSS